MKAFWIAYVVATLSLLGFCAFIVCGPRFTAAISVGTFASSVWLIYKRRVVATQKHLIALALLAGAGSVASGFILILSILILGEFFR